MRLFSNHPNLASRPRSSMVALGVAALLSAACSGEASGSMALPPGASGAPGAVDGLGRPASMGAADTSVTAPAAEMGGASGAPAGGPGAASGPSVTPPQTDGAGIMADRATGGSGASAAPGDQDVPEGKDDDTGSTAGAAPAAAGAEGADGAMGDMPTAEPDSDGPRPLPKFVGNITTRGQVRPDFLEFWQQLTPENEGKWGSVERERDQMDWAPLDRAYAFAQQHGMPFKQHTFVWGSQQPRWIDGLSREEQREEVEEWIRLYCERYPDTELIDVVNEPPPHTMPTYMEALGGAGASGYDWIVQSFKWARTYCPKAILILNDYNNIEYGNDNSHFVDIVRRIKAAGAPIDALGAQSHDAHKRSNDELRGYIDNLASTGLPIFISEYDINVADDQQQKAIMERQFPLFWDDERILGITLWGYINQATWLPNTGLMSESGQQRPAMEWLLEYMATH